MEEFIKFYDDCLKSMESLHKLLQSNKSIRLTEADVELKKYAQQHATVQCNIETVIVMGKWKSFFGVFVVRTFNYKTDNFINFPYGIIC